MILIEIKKTSKRKTNFIKQWIILKIQFSQSSKSTWIFFYRALNLTGDQTNIAAGLRVARSDILNTNTGWRPEKVTVALLITDGESNIEKTRTVPEANALKRNGVELFVVGVGTQINRDELNNLASVPVNNHLFIAETFPSLDKLWSSVSQGICNAQGAQGISYSRFVL